MYDLGTSVAIATTVTDAAGVETTAATAVLTITLPDGTTATPAVGTPTDAGRYLVTYVPTQPGRHVVRWVFTNPDAAVTDVFDVEPADPGFIVSLADARTHLNLRSSTNDDELRSFIAAATEVIEKDPDIGVGPVVVRTYTEQASAGRCLTLWRTPVVSITSVEPYQTVGTSYDPAGLVFDSVTGIVERSDGLWFTGGPFSVTYKAGRSVVPANIRLAALEMIKHWWESQRGPAVGARPPVSGEPVVTVSSGYAIPTRCAQMLRAFKMGPLVG